MVWLADHYLGREMRLWNALSRSMGPSYEKGFQMLPR
jgi:hypothetical protein